MTAPASPYLTLSEARDYLRYPTNNALRTGMRRYGIPFRKRGRTLFFDVRELDRFMRAITEVSVKNGRRRIQKRAASV